MTVTCEVTVTGLHNLSGEAQPLLRCSQMWGIIVPGGKINRMDYERRAGGCFVAEHRAAYLAELGRLEESLLAYEDLAARESLSEQARERVRQNINRLRAQLA